MVLGQQSGAVTHGGSQAEPCSPCNLLFLLEPLHEQLLDVFLTRQIWSGAGRSSCPPLKLRSWTQYIPGLQDAGRLPF